MHILITGAASGIGLDTVMQLQQFGHRVTATVKNAEQKKELVRKLSGQDATVLILDVTDASAFSQLHNLDPDVLITSAAIGESGSLVDIPLQRVQHLIDINVLGTLRCVQSVAPGMIERCSGKIILLSSGAGRVSVPSFGAYSMTKFAIEAMGDSLRRELKPQGVQVTIVEPGAIATGFNVKMVNSKYEWVAKSVFSNKLLSHWKKTDQKFLSNQADVRVISDAIVKLVTAEHMPARVCLPHSTSLVLKLVGLLPDRIVDWALRTWR